MNQNKEAKNISWNTLSLVSFFSYSRWISRFISTESTNSELVACYIFMSCLGVQERSLRQVRQWHLPIFPSLSWNPEGGWDLGSGWYPTEDAGWCWAWRVFVSSFPLEVEVFLDIWDLGIWSLKTCKFGIQHVPVQCLSKLSHWTLRRLPFGMMPRRNTPPES